MSHDRLRVLFCDHLNLARGKYLPANQIDKGESRFCRGVYALTYDKDLIPVPASTLLEGLPDMIARYDANEIRPGWRSDEQVVIADQFDSGGQPLGGMRPQFAQTHRGRVGCAGFSTQSRH